MATVERRRVPVRGGRSFAAGRIVLYLPSHFTASVERLTRDGVKARIYMLWCQYRGVGRRQSRVDVPKVWRAAGPPSHLSTAVVSSSALHFHRPVTQDCEPVNNRKARSNYR